MRESNTSQKSVGHDGRSAGAAWPGFGVAWFAWVLLAALLALGRGLPPRLDGPAGLTARRIDLARDPVPILALLPGLGPARAEALVLDRIRHGPARSWSDLQRIDGFGPGVVESIREHAVLGFEPVKAPIEPASDRPIR